MLYRGSSSFNQKVAIIKAAYLEQFYNIYFKFGPDIEYGWIYSQKTEVGMGLLTNPFLKLSAALCVGLREKFIKQHLKLECSLRAAF